MPTLTRDSRFFGLDLLALARDLGAAWQRMRRWPLLAWLTPEYPVCLVHADGGESLWFASEALRPARAGESRAAARFFALELPEEIVLRRSLIVPAALTDAQAADAIALDIASASPFPAADTVCGHVALPAAGGQRRIEAALASRRQIERFLAQAAAPRAGDRERDPAGSREVWTRAGQLAPIVMTGFGEERRAREIERGRRLRLGLLAVAALFAIAIAVTPTVQLRLRALQAVSSFEALNQRAAPLLVKREALVAAADRLSALSTILGARLDPLRVLDLVTQVLPDDTWLQGMQIDGRKVVISGQTGNAAALMQTIGNRAGLRDVKAPTPAYRQPGMAKENFTIEFMLEPQAFEHPAAPGSGPATASGTDRRSLLAITTRIAGS